MRNNTHFPQPPNYPPAPPPPPRINECHVQDVQPAEPGLSSGLVSPKSERESSLVEGLLELTRAINEQNQLLIQIVAQNADLIQALSSEEGDEPTHDLSGKPL